MEVVSFATYLGFGTTNSFFRMSNVRMLGLRN